MPHYYKPALWAFMLMVAIATTGCITSPSKPATTEEFLTNTTQLVNEAAQALGMALDMGTLAVDSEAYAQAYVAIVRARDLLQTAWQAYAQGDVGRAQIAGDLALALYIEVRPLIPELVGVDE